MPGIPNYLLDRTVAPTSEPLLLEACKRQCSINLEDPYFDRFFDSDSDASSIGAIKAAREYVERSARVALMKQTFTLSLRSFDQLDPATNDPDECSIRSVPESTGWLDLMIHPVQSVSAIEYVDENGDVQELDESQFTVKRSYHRSLLAPNESITFPATGTGMYPITLTLVCGFSASDDAAVQRAAVPSHARMAMLALVAHWYKNREAVLVGAVSKEIEFSLKDILTQIRPLRYV